MFSSSYLGLEFPGSIDSSACFTDANREVPGLRIHRGETHRFNAVLGQDERLPRGRVEGETLLVLELTVDLHLQAAILAVADVGGDFETAIVQRSFLDAGTGDRVGRAGIH